MSAVNEQIVREYFEALGYLVSQPRKHVVPGRHKQADEEVDLVIQHPLVAEHAPPPKTIWTTTDLSTVGRAVVGIRGWHTERFYASTIAQSPDILRFAEEESLRYARSILGEGPLATILCLPRLPASPALKEDILEALVKNGVDGVLSFETILGELISRVDTQKNYEKSDILQIIRILKNYDFFRDAQLDLFAKPRRRRRTSRKEAAVLEAMPTEPEVAESEDA